MTERSGDAWIEGLLVRLRLLAAAVPLVMALIYPDVVRPAAAVLSVAIVAPVHV